MRALKEQMREGLIPAHAGKTYLAACLDCGVMGSSPLTRGKPPSLIPRLRPRRLIPAHAGKTMSPGTTQPPQRAHPRSRGENSAPSRIA